MFTAVKVHTLINEIREALILDHGPSFLKLSVKDQEALIIKSYFDTITED